MNFLGILAAEGDSAVFFLKFKLLLYCCIFLNSGHVAMSGVPPNDSEVVAVGLVLRLCHLMPLYNNVHGGLLATEVMLI